MKTEHRKHNDKANAVHNNKVRDQLSEKIYCELYAGHIYSS